MKDKRTKVEVECAVCNATGLYMGWAEPKGVAVICSYCRGTGHVSSVVFVARKPRKGVKTVMRNGVPPSERISYEQFEKGEMPKH